MFMVLLIYARQEWALTYSPVFCHNMYLFIWSEFHIRYPKFWLMVVLEKLQHKIRLRIFLVCFTAHTLQYVIVCCIAEPTCHLPAVSKVLPSFRESPSGRLMRQDPVVHLSPNKQGHVSYPKKGII